VRDRFYDSHLNGLDWQEQRARFRPDAVSAPSRENAAVVINAMLAKLGASHTHFYTPEEPAYYQLADIFVGPLEHRGLDRVFPRGEVSYPGVGVFTEADDQGRTFVTGVIEGAPAQAAGVLLGDEIVSADNRPFRPVGSFRGKVGSPVSLEIRRASGAAPIAIAVSPADLHPNEMFLRGLKASARVIATDEAKIGYVHVWSYASHRMQSALEDLISDGRSRTLTRWSGICAVDGAAPNRNISTSSIRARPRCRSRVATARPASSTSNGASRWPL
jgi:carboxyl-terminal processing protease